MKSKYVTKENKIWVSIPVAIFIVLLFTSNMVTGYLICNSMNPIFNQPWKEAMDYLATQTPENSSILSWWDFGYWFQTRGKRPSIADGGNQNGTVDEQIAEWFTSNSQNWTNYRWWMKSKDVKYILMDYSLPGKYGAISKIASRGKQVVGMLELRQTAMYPQENKTIIEFRAGEYAVWLPVGNNGNIIGSPIFMMSSGDQYVGRSYITDICTINGIIRFQAPENANTIPGCIAITAYGMFFVPAEAEFTIFTNLMFMDAYEIPDLTKVFDNSLIKIYKLEINETVSS